MLNKAIEIAARAHAGQTDKAGEPYIFHPLRVMLSCNTELTRICAVLHDVIEDTEITLDALRSEGFSEEVIAVIDFLSRRENESYDNFIGRIMENETACYVKLADLADNMRLSRIPDPQDEDVARIKKYEKATERIRNRLTHY